MIFVTLGTTNFPFDRLLEGVDVAIESLNLREKLVVQAKVSNYKFRHKKTKIIKVTDYGGIISYLKKSRIVITHGGSATVYLSLKYCRNRPLIIPRSKKYREHVDDHQIYFVQFLKKRNFGEIILEQKNLEIKIGQYLLKPRQNKSIEENNQAKMDLIKKLNDFCLKLNSKKT